MSDQRKEYQPSVPGGLETCDTVAKCGHQRNAVHRGNEKEFDSKNMMSESSPEASTGAFCLMSAFTVLQVKIHWEDPERSGYKEDTELMNMLVSAHQARRRGGSNGERSQMDKWCRKEREEQDHEL